MKETFKRLGLAAAVAAVSVGYAGVAYSQDGPTDPGGDFPGGDPGGADPAGDGAARVSDNGLGDLAIVPYYTVKNGLTTGMSLINTSDRTQVVKLRMRRARDSMDALDINIVMSPRDVWTANVREEEGTIFLITDDTTCTVPAGNAGPGRFQMSPLYNASGDAEEGYIEFIGMGSPLRQFSASSEFNGASGESTRVAYYAKHVDDVPRDCDMVRQNFFSQDGGALTAAGKAITPYGNLNYNLTEMQTPDSQGAPQQVQTVWGDTGDVLRVSYLIRDRDAGLEFGNEGVMVQGFLDRASMSNQQFGLFSLDASGFDYPDLNGGQPVYAAPSSSAGTPGNYSSLAATSGGIDPGLGVSVDRQDRDRFRELRDAVGVISVLNDWSTNPSNGVATDWVVTFPGQYTMFDYYAKNAELFGAYGSAKCGELIQTVGTTNYLAPECDYRDLPVTATFSAWNREEFKGATGTGDLVVSPSVPGQAQTTLLQYEVNVVEWTGSGSGAPVLGSDFAIEVDTSALGVFGWSSLSVSTSRANRQVCDVRYNINPALAPAGGKYGPADDDIVPLGTCVPVRDNDIPITGFVAWERSFENEPDRNYGRIVEHAFTSSSDPS